jgi:OmpA-OmpF porin, OOP family
MKSNSAFFVFALLASAFCASAQQDTLVWAEGRVLNAETKEPVSARFTYQSLPYGSRIGAASGTTYSFPFLDGERYSITVQAEGFEPAKFMLDPAEANTERRVIKDIELKRGSAPPVHKAGTVLRLENLTFQQNASRIEPASFEELDELVDILKANTKMIIQLEGHTDYIGPVKGNLALSEKRVLAIKDYLVKKGIAKARIKTLAFGGTKPLSREDTPEAHAANRRVEVRVLAN